MNPFHKELEQLNLSYTQIELVKQAVEKHIIGEDEDRNHRYNKNWQVEIDARNYQRQEQRKALYGEEQQ